MPHALGINLGISRGNRARGGAEILLDQLAYEPNGVAWDFTDGTMVIRDTVTPANNFSGDPFSKFVLTRASAGRNYNNSGLIVSAGNNISRYDNYPGTLLPRGVLLEEGRTNLLLRSEEFDNASWIKTDITPTANTATAPDNAVTADLITEGSAGTALLSQTVTVTANINYTSSIFIKRGNTDWVRLRWFDGAAGVDAWFNLGAGVKGALTLIGTGTATQSRMEALPGGWFRIQVSGIVAAASVSASFQLNSASADSSATRVNGATYTIWGSGTEAGGYASSYIPTVAVTVSRSADTTTLIGTSFPLSQTAGTLFLEGEYAGVIQASGSLGAAGIITINDLTTNERASLRLNNSAGGSSMFIVDNAVTQADVQIAGSVAYTVYKAGGVYALNDFHQARGGVLSGTPDTLGTLPTTTHLVLGSSSTGSALNVSWQRRGMYIPRRVTNTELQTLTT